MRCSIRPPSALLHGAVVPRGARISKRRRRLPREAEVPEAGGDSVAKAELRRTANDQGLAGAAGFEIHPGTADAARALWAEPATISNAPRKKDGPSGSAVAAAMRWWVMAWTG